MVCLCHLLNIRPYRGENDQNRQNLTQKIHRKRVKYASTTAKTDPRQYNFHFYCFFINSNWFEQLFKEGKVSTGNIHLTPYLVYGPSPLRFCHFSTMSKKPSRIFFKILFRLAVPNWYEKVSPWIVTPYFDKIWGLKYSGGQGGVPLVDNFSAESGENDQNREKSNLKKVQLATIC